ncbi:cobaltochelatase CobN subunit [Pyrobaculum islandicum DSM 4184]|uniref:Cobaltochelatase CobN subunit n=1 Tax=Pyrobaculum islandicum (strain DSM 4184 / JCM 9189 / GEO3) TaxID=384616 RepID=A1RR27_PYRIL|nr:magnesium chelatase subunit H [Pyrobaculum islandicum]ABL87409.1 cobaltochelatase CobN subunit [Pyrobaculum islandicum DSM 4184]
MKIVIISTKPSLRTLFDAAKEVEAEAGVSIELQTYYIHSSVDYAAVENADVILIDVRGGAPRELINAVEKSRAKVVIPLVGGSPGTLALLRLGGFSGVEIAKRVPEQDFDTDRVDFSKISKVLSAVETAGRVLPVGPLRHLRNWIWATKYWAYWGRENLANLFKLILAEYFGAGVKYGEPKLVGEFAVYTPGIGFTYKPPETKGPVVLIFTYAGMHFDETLPVALKLKEELEKLGVNAFIATGGVTDGLLKQLEALRKYTLVGGRSVDAVINLQWFVINGGPYGGSPEPTRELFKERGSLLFNGLVAYTRRISQWEKDPRGLSPVEVVGGVALPEIDGAIEPIISAGLDDSIYAEMVVLEERVKKKARRVANWIKLRQKPPSERRVAIVIYNYPPGEHNVGNAAYLDTLASLAVILKALREAGYRTRALDKEELRRLIAERFLVNSPQWGSHGDVPKLPVSEYLRWFNTLANRDEVIKTWGEPPGGVNVEGDSFLIPGVVLDNVFIGVQPPRGFHEDPSKLYHSKDIPPHHQYLAFYYWIKEVFKADAIIHVGTHGTLELMPGKEVGLSDRCWPDILIGDTPHIYIYHVTNPSEKTIAKRRSYAYIITHGTPPFTHADLYGEYVELEELLEEAEKGGEDVRRLIEEKCRKLNLPCGDLERLHDYLMEMKRAVIPRGLHVFGSRWSVEDVVNYITFVLRREGDVPSLHRLILEERGVNYDGVEKAGGGRLLVEAEEEARRMIKEALSGGDPAKYFKKRRREAEEVFRYVRDLAKRILESDEVSSLLKALDGRYVEPRVAGEPLRTPEVFPTGSHGYAFDPRLIPTKAAYIRGINLAEELVKRYREKYGRYPESVAVVLWGFETAQTRGETVGQILQLLGVRLVRKHGPWAPELEPIPLEELGRPRIDVVVTICGFFRDMFPNLISLIDRAVKLVASLDEPLEMNYVRKHYLEIGRITRIFGPKPGTYGTRLPEFIESSSWKNEGELVEVYVGDMMYGYGDDIHGEAMRELFVQLLKKVEVVSQVRSATEYDIADLDHYYEFLGGLKKAVETLAGRRVEAYWVDATGEKMRIRTVEEAVDFALRTRLLNPKWAEEMLKHGYDGAREIAKRVEYVLGHAALTGTVDRWFWRQIAEMYVKNIEMRERIKTVNPWALYEIIKRLEEAHRRGYWEGDEEIRKIAEELEGILEE